MIVRGRPEAVQDVPAHPSRHLSGGAVQRRVGQVGAKQLLRQAGGDGDPLTVARVAEHAFPAQIGGPGLEEQGDVAQGAGLPASRAEIVHADEA